eukprot:CAMPEP_0169175022 /NCGR_PEP_ID=MMETSP1015-20121227/64959_1 /TAXON_ID=342587 /ORGANISM="Karlodinium micrum, Strain CCMP2283" /LENGTH=596 /DNA_ID=CAMNT_0009249123 /DNA_START=326 /DNA_END=2116 /DNA_ORIENTATION=+
MRATQKSVVRSSGVEQRIAESVRTAQIDMRERHENSDQQLSPDALRLIVQDLQIKLLLLLGAIFAGCRIPDLWQFLRRRTGGVLAASKRRLWAESEQAADPQMEGTPVVRSRCSSPVACAESESDSPPSFAELLKFTFFAMPIYVSPTLLSLIDTATVGQISSMQLAALGPACAICDSLTGLMVFISIGTTNALSSALGKGEKAEGKRIASVSVLLSLMLGCVVAVALYGSIGPIIAKYALPGALANTMARTGGSAAAAAATTQLWASCETYVKIRALSFPAALVLMSAQAACLGAKDSTSPTLATLLASVVNIVGDVVLVLGPLAMGIAGAAWATVGCQIAAAAMLLRTLRRKGLLDRESFFKVPSRQDVKRFFAFAGFIFVLFTKQIVYNQAVVLASILGTAAGAAHQCLYSLFRVCCTLGDVTGATAQAFLPRYYVTDEETGKVSFNAAAAGGTMKRIVGMTAIVAVCNTLITFAVPLLKPGFFTADKEVISLFRRAAPFAAAGLLMHPTVVGMEGCLLATKDIRWLATNYAATGALSVLAAYLLLNIPFFQMRLNVNTIWIYLATYQVVRFFTFIWRLFTKTMQRKEFESAA